MAKQRVTFLCDDCGATAPQWAGQCAACSAWNTMVEVPFAAPSAATATSEPVRPFTEAVRIGDLGLDVERTRSTGLPEVDRVLGGGLVPGSVTLIGGEPGIGKSTLLTQLAAAMARAGDDVLYVSAEESAQQVRLRAERLDALSPRLWLAPETTLAHIVTQLDRVQPA